MYTRTCKLHLFEKRENKLPRLKNDVVMIKLIKSLDNPTAAKNAVPRFIY
jgi:hypothetical protein